jgi:predicted ATPase/signal transduction histidine kinase/GAF domain-containing protein
VIELSRYAFSVLQEAECTLYRGRGAGLDPILLVAPAMEGPAVDCVRRLEREYALRTELNPCWAAKPVAFAHYCNRRALVLHDPGGVPLDGLLGGALNVQQFLSIAVPLAAACRQMHETSLIHKDIKPANVLVDTTGGGVWFTGFGIASRLPREHQDPVPPEVVAGTLAYMAPEQTGRMNRSIDSRSDLYALGATLYEMLTGAPPFTASDPMELVHCHVARQPIPPHERITTIPEQISLIVMKLLAKTMEERYQTAAGVQVDLRRCSSEWESRGWIDPFPLGTRDAPDRLLMPENLYGRQREIKQLIAAFNRVVSRGLPELVLVSGYSGVGKSSVVNELRKVLVAPRALFAAGKCDQHKRDIPYATLAQAFQSLVRIVLGRNDPELAQWRDAMRAALGPHGQLMVNLIPELELILGPQSPLPDLPPEDARNRFQMVFRRFVGVFAKPQHPLALFFDDLQWVDAATLDLMQDLITQNEVEYLLVIGAYRENEVGASHPLILALNAIRAPIHHIELAPLGLEDVGQLIAGALRCAEDQARPLAHLVHDKTGGNPFFAIQFVTELVEEKLLTFDCDLAAWNWNLPFIRDKGYTDNVIDLMGSRLSRLSATSQTALRRFACLGNVADLAMLTVLQGQSEDAVHEALSEVVRSGLVIRMNGSYRFAHDRVHEAAYALVPDNERAAAHLSIARSLTAKLSPQRITESVFDIVNQFNAGFELIRDSEEKELAARLSLLAAERAKAATAYASAVRYLSIGIDSLGSHGWHRQYDLTFALWIEAAECEYLNGNFERAGSLIAEVLSRARSNADKAAAHRIRIIIHVAMADYNEAIACGLECLRLFGVTIAAQPSPAEVLAEYERIWDNLSARSIENLVDLPLISDPETQAVVSVLTFLFAPASFINNNLFYMLICRGANLTLRHGTANVSTHIYSGLAQILGPVFHRYEDGFRFGTLGRAVAERYGFVGTKACFAMECACVWSRPLQIAIDFIRQAFRLATETSDLSYACYSCFRLVTDLLLQGAHLDEVWSESQKGLEYVRGVKFQAAIDVMISQQLLIKNLRGETKEFSSFDSEAFREEEFEAKIVKERMPTLVCWYWILKLQARFMSGDFEVARSAADKAEALLWASEAFIQSANYCYYRALTIAARNPSSGAHRRAEDLEALRRHLVQLKEWANACPDTFGDKYSLVSAEIARLENRELDAERLYEEAIQSAGQRGFVQNEAIANELAARFYASRGFATIALTYLRNARYCYQRWGAVGKVRQLERDHPQLRADSMSVRSTGTIDTSIEQIDAATVVKASQAILGEIVLDKLIKILMTMALEHAGAERGLLMLLRNGSLQIQAEAATATGAVDVVLRQAVSSPAELPQSLLHTVMRTRQRVMLDDAQRANPFSDDEYVARRGPRSILCLPLVKQAELIGLLYLENNLAPSTFTPRRIAVLELLASQAAISLENAGLYAELIAENRERTKVEASLAEGQRISRTGSWRWNVKSGAVQWSAEHFRIFGMDPALEKPSYARYMEKIHPEDHFLVEQVLTQALQEQRAFRHEYRIALPNALIKHVQSIGHPVVDEAGELEFVGTIMDITERRQAEEALRRSQMELARAWRLSTMGELAGSIIHETNQPLAAIVMNAEACLRWLNRDPPNLEEARSAIARLARDSQRAADVIKGLRALARKSGSELTHVDVNDAIREVLLLLGGELERGAVVLHVDLLKLERTVLGDRVQLQQLMLNLIRNAIEAMGTVADRPRILRISSELKASNELLVAVADSGAGLDSEIQDRIFEPLFTTKREGMGMGLSICRSIVQTHRGRLWASPNAPHGTIFQFTVPFAAIET